VPYWLEQLLNLVLVVVQQCRTTTSGLRRTG